MSLKKMLENYDEALLKNLEFEIRINNWIKATFKDINETERYIKLIVHNGYRWFIANDRILQNQMKNLIKQFMNMLKKY